MQESQIKRSILFMAAITVAAALCSTTVLAEDGPDKRTDWLKDAGHGVFMHFLPGDTASLALVEKFDVDALGAQLGSVGAKYFVITLGQNSGYFISPNAAYDRYTGYAPGQRCATRDLPLELFRALKPKGIRLMLYLPCQTPNQDVRAQKAFGLRQGAADQPIDLTFAEKWAEVIQEWSDRYGDKVSGWWFDGGYEHIHFNEAIAQVYARAAKHGNPHILVTFNPGVKVVRYTQAEDYTAGELNEPFDTIPSSRWLEGSQWHALTYLGSRWARRDIRFPPERWARWVKQVVAQGGVVTLDAGPNWDLQAAPIGSLAEPQIRALKAIHLAVDPPGDWIELLPGKDLTAWREPRGDWNVVAKVTMDPQDSRKLAWRSGTDAAVNGAKGNTVNLVSVHEFGDIEAHIEFLIPRQSNSGIYFMGRYELQVYDSYGVVKDKYPGIECGGIYPRWVGHEIEGHSPRVNASLPPGQWQTFDVVFRAPRFDAAGRKVRNGAFVKVLHNGALIHDNVEVTGPTRSSLYDDEKPTGPLMLQADHGPVSYRSVRVRRLPPLDSPQGSKENGTGR